MKREYRCRALNVRKVATTRLFLRRSRYGDAIRDREGELWTSTLILVRASDARINGRRNIARRSIGARESISASIPRTLFIPTSSRVKKCRGDQPGVAANDTVKSTIRERSLFPVRTIVSALAILHRRFPRETEDVRSPSSTLPLTAFVIRLQQSSRRVPTGMT